MENKKSFGAYICQRRKELGLTQKEFAQKLFVTDSAVSKWERGLAYPDITLLQSICQILDISEKELLSCSEDVEGRRSEQLARKYLRLARNYRLIQYILYGLTAVVCFICNLCVSHRLDWFFIVVAAELVAASLTLLPALVPEGTKWLWSLGGFTVSLLLLLAVCCIFVGGNWFFVAAAGVLFGMWLAFGPWVLRHIPLPEALANQKFNLYLGSSTALLVLLLGISCLFVHGDWFLTAAVWTVFGIFAGLGPMVIRLLPLAPPLDRHRSLLYVGAASLFLIGALAYQGWGDWFPLPGLYIALTGLALVWAWLGALRYLPLNGWGRTGVGFLFTGLWTWLSPWALDQAMAAKGWYSTNPEVLLLPVDFTNWHDFQVVDANIQALVIFGFALAGVASCIIGFVIWRKKR